MSSSAVHLEDVIKEIGGCGRFQTILVILLHSMKCVVCFTMVFMVFGAAVPDWWCMDDLIGQNVSDVIGKRNLPQFKSCTSANDTKVCSSFLYADTMNTVVTEWDLLCDQAWIPQTITSLQMAGVLTGHLLCGQIADLIGRKKPLFLAFTLLMGLNFVSVFSTSWVMFAVFRVFLGLGLGIATTVYYSIATEFTLARWRAWSVALPSWPLELALFAFVAWLCKNWKYIHAVTAGICLLFMASWWFIPESFRWYMSHDRIKDAEKTVKYVAKINGHKHLDMGLLKRLTETEKSEEIERRSERKYTILDIFRHRSILKLTLLLAWMWFSVGLCGYGIQFGIQKLSGDLYLNMFVLGAIGIPFCFLTIYLCNRLGRKKAIWLLTGGSSVTAVLVGIAQYLEDQNMGHLLANVCAISSLTLMNAAWSGLQILTLELYPTVVRNIGYGSQNILARVGSIIGPQLVFLGTMVPGLLYFICAAAGILTMVLLIFIPETLDNDLPDMIVVTTDDPTGKETDIMKADS